MARWAEVRCSGGDALTISGTSAVWGFDCASVIKRNLGVIFLKETFPFSIWTTFFKVQLFWSVEESVGGFNWLSEQRWLTRETSGNRSHLTNFCMSIFLVASFEIIVCDFNMSHHSKIKPTFFYFTLKPYSNQTSLVLPKGIILKLNTKMLTSVLVLGFAEIFKLLDEKISTWKQKHPVWLKWLCLSDQAGREWEISIIFRER